MHLVALFAATMLLALQAPFARADEPEASDAIRLDSARSEVGFTVKLVWLVGIDGRFGQIDGVVRSDRFRSQISVDARIRADAISMSTHLYENWVKSPEFFDVEKYPYIEFTSEPLPEARLRKGGDLNGMLTLRGIRQPVTFRLLPATCERPAYGCPIQVVGAIRRSEFGMRSRRGALSDKVELRFNVYAVSTDGGAP